MYWIQFYRKDLSGRLSAAVGDRSVIVVDGRLSFANMKRKAKEHNRHARIKFDAFQIKKGWSFTRSQPLTDVIAMEDV